ncbi:MAG: hypothetical protein NW206_03145 [Hyphomonadaceae bacterium]|nr:hypothetical protein [Hyphomonadaceae bacterium]
MRLLVVLAACALAACGQSSAPTEPGAPAEGVAQAGSAYQLTCADFAGVTLASLQERFGAENVVDQTLDGPEGMQYGATVIYPNDAARRLEVIWAEGAEHARAQNVLVEGQGNLWVGPHGLQVDMALADLETANGGPFDISGFGWDYGGSVTEWRGGAFSRAGCVVFARLSPAGEAHGAQGDAIFRSDSPAMQAANANVYEFGLGFPAE